MAGAPPEWSDFASLKIDRAADGSAHPATLPTSGIEIAKSAVIWNEDLCPVDVEVGGMRWRQKIGYTAAPASGS